jgi:hypothetical protein
MTSTDKAGLGRYYLMFLGLFLVGAAIVNLVTSLLDFETPAAMGIIITMFSAMGPAQAFVRKEGRPMSRGEKLRFATVCTVLSLTLSLGFFLAVFAYYGVPLRPDAIMQALNLPPGDFAILLAVLGFAVVLTWLVILAGVHFGGKGALKQIEREKAKAAK